MLLLRRAKKYLSGSLPTETAPEAAYNLWAESYDAQPDNLMLALDEALFSDLIKNSNWKNKVIADIGCGTGRHWKKILAKEPQKLSGYDVSAEMLKKLKEKFPKASTYQLQNNHLPGLQNESCDIVISTLAIAHIKNIKESFQEWDRVLKPNGEIFITDYHPDLLSRGGNRTFRHDDKLIAVKNYIHPIETIKEIATQLHFEILNFAEKIIDDSVKHYYEKQHAIELYEKFKGTPLIYGLHLKKKNVAA